MHQPLISAICLTADRPDFLKKAIRCFEAQTWHNKELIIYDTGRASVPVEDIPGVCFVHGQRYPTIGELRNAAIKRAKGCLIANWDDDDISHPRRLEEQANLLLAADAEIVGYSTLYFFNQMKDEWWLYDGDIGSLSDAVGTSMMFRASIWKTRHFGQIQCGEEYDFQINRRVVTTYGHNPPRMIAVSHGKNSTSANIKFVEGTAYTETNWRRAKPDKIAGLRELLDSFEL